MAWPRSESDGTRAVRTGEVNVAFEEAR